MRHGNHNRKFGRKTDQRRALLNGLCRSLVIRGKIKTTEARAKHNADLRPDTRMFPDVAQRLIELFAQFHVTMRRLPRLVGTGFIRGSVVTPNAGVQPGPSKG